MVICSLSKLTDIYWQYFSKIGDIHLAFTCWRDAMDCLVLDRLDFAWEANKEPLYIWCWPWAFHQFLYLRLHPPSQRSKRHCGLFHRCRKEQIHDRSNNANYSPAFFGGLFKWELMCHAIKRLTASLKPMVPLAVAHADICTKRLLIRMQATCLMMIADKHIGNGHYTQVRYMCDVVVFYLC